MEIPKEYIPYGPEWEKEITKLPKAAIIKMFASKGTELSDLRDKHAFLCKEYNRVIDKLNELDGTDTTGS